MRDRLRVIAARLPKRRLGIAMLALLIVGAVVAVFARAWIVAGLLSLAAVAVGLVGAAWWQRRRRQRAAEHARDLAVSLTPRETRPPLDRYAYAATIRRSPWVLLRLGARFRSTAALDLLARRASRGQLDWSGLCRALIARRLDPLPDGWWVKEILAAAYLAMMLDDSTERIDAARAATHLALDLGEVDAFGHQPQLSWAFQAAVGSRDAELVERLAQFESVYPEALWAARLDLAGAPLSAPWRERFAELTRVEGLEEWGFDSAGADTVFGSLRAPEVADRVVDGPMVSVIVPTFNPDRTFACTIESLVRQTWRNLEILIVDDASTTGLDAIAAAARSDARVQVIRHTTNGGAYRARNTGIIAAAGEYVTVLDADDLAHPRRIERQLAPLLDSRQVVATLCRAVRITVDGRVTVTGFTPERMNTSSLLFRREAVVGRIGLYDPVRKAGDTEFMERMRLALPDDSIVELPDHLGLTQLTAGSLSRGDFKPGNWHSGDRVAYRRQFRGWHTHGNPGIFPLHPDEPRPFHAPARIAGAEPRSRFAVAVLRDWAPAVERFDDWAGALEHLSEHVETPIALLNGAHPRHTSHKHEPVRESTWRLVEGGRAEWLSWAAATRIDTLIVTDSEYLLLLPDAHEIGLDVARVLVVQETRVNLEDRGAAAIDAGLVSAACERAFGVAPQWVVGLGGDDALSVPGGAAATRAVFPRAGAARSAPPADPGLRFGLVNLGLPPEAGAYERWFTEHLGGADVTLLREAAGGDSTAVLDRADVLIIDPFDRRASLRHDLVWHAMRSGVIVCAPQRYRDVYGAAILPGGSSEIVATLADLRAHPERLAEQRDIAAHVLAEHDAAVRLFS